MSSRLRRCMMVLLATICLGPSMLAASLESYKAKIDSARSAASAVEVALRDGEIDQARDSGFTATVRRDFPLTENVEWNGGGVEVSNDWLLARASDFDAATEAEKRLVVVVAMREFLSSISFKLSELQQPPANQRTKDEDKQKLAEILRREEYQKPQPVKQSAFQRWLLEFLEWLAGIWPKPKSPGQGLSGMESLVFILRAVLYLALAALLAFLVFKIAPMIFPKLKRSRKPRKQKSRIILGEHIAEDQTAADLLGDAERLAREGNLRGAIRKGYVALLCDLSDRKIIGLARNKTNRDYLRDVRARVELHPRMKAATETFERHWYGFQESDEQDWLRFRNEYAETIRSV